MASGDHHSNSHPLTTVAVGSSGVAGSVIAKISQDEYAMMVGLAVGVATLISIVMDIWLKWRRRNNP